MGAWLVLLGMAIRLATIASTVYLLWNGRWHIILMAFGFSFVTPVVAASVNWAMARFWKEMRYPEALSTPGLVLLVNPVRLMLVSRIPLLAYALVGYTIGLAVFAGFGSAEHALERAASMLVAYEAGFAVPTAIAQSAGRESSTRSAFFSGQLYFGKVALLVLIGVHATTPLAFWPAAALLALAVLLLEIGFEIHARRRALVDLLDGAAR